MKSVFYILSFVSIILLLSCSTSSKTTEVSGNNGHQQKHFSEEQIEMDALAMAEIQCQYEIAKYNLDRQPDNFRLQQEEKELSGVKKDLEEKMKIRYLQIDELSKKYNKALEKANGELSNCLRAAEIREMLEQKALIEEQNNE